jgi:arylsulfatase A-like enzyme
MPFTRRSLLRGGATGVAGASGAFAGCAGDTDGGTTATATPTTGASTGATRTTSGSAGRNDHPPNVVLIFPDDAGYADFTSWGGETPIETPNVQRLSENGVRCTEGYVSAPVCSPSRAGICTGRHQNHFGHQMNLPGSPEWGEERADLGLPTSEDTFGTVLGEQGYATACIGKWHLGYEDHHHPNERGFDYFFGMLGGARDYVPQPDLANKGWYRNQKRLRENDAFYPEEGEWYTTDLFTDKTIEFMQDHEDEPFFTFLSHNAVHKPNQAKDEDLAKYDHIEDETRQTIAAMTEALDRSTGRILDYLEESGQAENTIVFFINDNGGTSNRPNDPYRGGKSSHFEGGVRVPFAVQWPGTLPEGDQYDQPVSALDVLPTALAAAGNPEAAASDHYDGVDILPYLRGEAAGRPHERLHWHHQLSSPSTIRKGDWKLIYDELAGEATHLFDLSADPQEEENRVEERPEKVQELRSDLKEWRLDNVAPKWLVKPRYMPNDGRLPEWEDELNTPLRNYQNTSTASSRSE